MTWPDCLNVIISLSLTNTCFLCQLTILNGITSNWSPSVSPRSVVSESDDVRPKIDRLFGLGEIIFGDILRAQQSGKMNMTEMSESNAAVAEARPSHECASRDNLSTTGHCGVALLESEQPLLCLDDSDTESDSISSITDQQQRDQKDINQSCRQ